MTVSTHAQNEGDQMGASLCKAALIKTLNYSYVFSSVTDVRMPTNVYSFRMLNLHCPPSRLLLVLFICYTEMFQIIKLMSILDKDNESKLKMHYLKDDLL